MKTQRLMKLVAVSLLVSMTLLTANGQSSRAHRDRYSRANTYGDVVELRLKDPGTLEEKMPKGMMDRVRLLHVEGPMDYKDFKFIKSLCNRSRCVDARDKKIENYIDLELERARIMSSSNGGLLGGHGDRDVLGDCLSYSSHLRSIMLPERLKRIDSDALRGCGQLEEVIMPVGVRELGNSAFSGCDRLEYIPLPDGLERIGRECFYGCDNLKTINIPRSVTEIGDKAFHGSGLQRVMLPEGLLSLGAKAFNNTSIDMLVIPAGTRIVNDDLGFMKKLEEIDVVEGSRYYASEDGVLYDNTGRLLLLYPAARKGIFDVPDGVEQIAPNAFYNSVVEGVRLPESLSIIGEAAFENCAGLTSIALPEGVSVVLPRTFKHCKNLKDVLFPTALTGIGKEAFEGCALVSIDLPSTLTTLGERAFKNCKGLTSVIVPDACTLVGKEAFRECTSLTTIDLGNGITSIGDNALRETAISTLVLPQSVTEVGKKVAEKCKLLTLIQCHAVLPPKLDGVSNNKVELRVPDASVPAYKSAKNWKNYKNINAITVVE